jgi:SAM-dependent methyltransferase
MNDHRSSAERWLGTALGKRVLSQEKDLVDLALAQVFGPQLLQIGRWGDEGAFLSLSRTRRSALIDSASRHVPCIHSSPEQLAVATHSVDAVLLPHTLERSCAPHQVLREVDRILVGDGHVIILGLNPTGPMGLRRVLSRKKFPEHCLALIRMRRIEDWLKLLGYEIRGTKRFCFAWPMKGLKAAHLEKIESLGSRCWPVLAGGYMVHAQKRVYGMTPIRPTARSRQRVGTGLAEPTARKMHD